MSPFCSGMIVPAATINMIVQQAINPPSEIIAELLHDIMTLCSRTPEIIDRVKTPGMLFRNTSICPNPA